MVLNNAPTSEYEHEDWEEEDGDRGPGIEAMLDADGKLRVNRGRCGTCIYHKENRMHLNEGALEQLQERADQDDTWIVCHQTLATAGYGAPPAVCYGYFHPHGRAASWPLRWADAHDALSFVEPPSLEWKGKP